MAVQAKTKRNWFVDEEFSEPARLLQEQAQTIAEEYAGVLYGTVGKDLLPPQNGVAYHLNVGITGKLFRFGSVSIRHKRETEYPVIVTNTLEGIGVKITNAEAFKQQVCAILHAPNTLDQFERMKEYAKKP